MMIYLNVALHANFPDELEEAFKLGKKDEMNAWAMEELRKLLDGEESVEFGAQLLGITVKTKDE